MERSKSTIKQHGFDSTHTSGFHLTMQKLRDTSQSSRHYTISQRPIMNPRDTSGNSTMRTFSVIKDKSQSGWVSKKQIPINTYGTQTST